MRKGNTLLSTIGIGLFSLGLLTSTANAAETKTQPPAQTAPAPVAGMPMPYPAMPMGGMPMMPMGGMPMMPYGGQPMSPEQMQQMQAQMQAQMQQMARPWTMSPMLDKAQKQQMMQMVMPYMGYMNLNIRDVMNLMTTKYKAKPGLSFDDVVESMKLRANSLNFKLVGHSPMWKDLQAVLEDKTAPRMEVFHFCDIAAGREVMKTVPEAIVFLPCRIAVMEDADKNIWVLTLDWDMAWLNSVNGSMGITPTLAKMAIDIRDRMDSIMQAGANGDL